MTPRTLALPALAATALLLAACAPATTLVPADAPVPAFDPALAAPGPWTTSVASATLPSVTGCTVRYEVHEPTAAAATAGVADVALADVAVVWSHGFLRDLASMRGWAELAASHGLRSAVVSTCASTPFAGRHDRNAEDLRAVAAAAFGAEAPVVYAGFSAGGLAAWLAAAADSRAVGVLGHDAVDSGGLAATALGFAGPALFLAGEPSSCNAQGNLVPVARQLPDARVVPIPYATHGDFELPNDPAVDRLCGRVEPPEARAALRAAIRGVAIEWLLERAAAR